MIRWVNALITMKEADIPWHHQIKALNFFKVEHLPRFCNAPCTILAPVSLPSWPRHRQNYWRDFRSFGQKRIRTTWPRFPVTFTHLHTNSYSFMSGLFMRLISYSFELYVSLFEKLSALNLTFAVAVKSPYQMQWPVESVLV